MAQSGGKQGKKGKRKHPTVLKKKEERTEDYKKDSEVLVEYMDEFESLFESESKSGSDVYPFPVIVDEFEGVIPLAPSHKPVVLPKVPAHVPLVHKTPARLMSKFSAKSKVPAVKVPTNSGEKVKPTFAVPSGVKKAEDPLKLLEGGSDDGSGESPKSKPKSVLKPVGKVSFRPWWEMKRYGLEFFGGVSRLLPDPNDVGPRYYPGAPGADGPGNAYGNLDQIWIINPPQEVIDSFDVGIRWVVPLNPGVAGAGPALFMFRVVLAPNIHARPHPNLFYVSLTDFHRQVSDIRTCIAWSELHRCIDLSGLHPIQGIGYLDAIAPVAGKADRSCYLNPPGDILHVRLLESDKVFRVSKGSLLFYSWNVASNPGLWIEEIGFGDEDLLSTKLRVFISNDETRGYVEKVWIAPINIVPFDSSFGSLTVIEKLVSQFYPIADQSREFTVGGAAYYDIAVAKQVLDIVSRSHATGNLLKNIIQTTRGFMTDSFHVLMASTDAHTFNLVVCGTVYWVLERTMAQDALLIGITQYVDNQAVNTNEYLNTYGSKRLDRSWLFLKVLLGVIATCIIWAVIQSKADNSSRHRRLTSDEGQGEFSYLWSFTFVFSSLLIGIAVYFKGQQDLKRQRALAFQRSLNKKEIPQGPSAGNFIAGVGRPLRITKSFSSDEMVVVPNTEHRAGLQVFTLDNVIGADGKFKFSGKSRGDPYFYVCGGLGSAWFMPANSANSVNLMLSKTLKAPVSSNLNQANAWLRLVHTCSLPCDSYSEIILHHRDIMEWIDDHDDIGKRRLYHHAFKTLKKADRKRMIQSEIMVKLDELLVVTKEAPRPIINMSPFMAVTFGPYIMEATRRLKKEWGVDHATRKDYYYGPFLVRPVWAPGRDFLELGQWADHVNSEMRDSFDIFLAGDDTLIRLCYSGRVYYLETDFSAYDASQGCEEIAGLVCGPLGFTFNMLCRLGVPEEKVDCLRRIYEQSIRAFNPTRDQTAVLRFTQDMMFPTGSPGTTFGNTVNNFGGWTAFCTHFKPRWLDNIELSISQFWLTLGLKVKVKRSATFSGLTFLKGRFIYSEYELNARVVSGYLWTPDMGVAAKFGYSKRHPTELYQKLNEQQAVGAYLSGVAKGWDTFPPTPVLRALIKRYKSDAGCIPVSEWRYKVSGRNDVLVLSADFSDMYSWYGVSESEVLQCEKDIMSLGHCEFLISALATKLWASTYADGYDGFW